jgi:hypothetical protein
MNAGRSVSYGINPGPPLNLISQLVRAGKAGMSWLVIRLLRVRQGLKNRH